MDRILAIDCGASKCLALFGELEAFASRDLGALREAMGGPANLRITGYETLFVELSKLSLLAPPEEKREIRVIAGFAGADSETARSRITRYFESAGFDPERLTIVSDSDLLLAALGHHGIAVIAGTGSIVAGCKGGRLDKAGANYARAGGWGYRFASPGSGYGMGLKLLELSARQLDGLEHSGERGLARAAAEAWNFTTIQEMIDKLYPADAPPGEIESRVAALCRLIFENPRDPCAISIAKDAARALAASIRAVHRRLSFGRCPLLLEGGLFASAASDVMLRQPLLAEIADLGLECRPGSTRGLLIALCDAVSFLASGA